MTPLAARIGVGDQYKETKNAMRQVKAAKRWSALLWAVGGPVVKAITRIETVGLEHVPVSGAAILVCTHRSSQDPRILASVTPRYVAWVAASHMRRILVVGWVMHKIGVVFVPTRRRGGAAGFFRRALAVLAEGEVLGMFPEGQGYIAANDFSAPPAPFHQGFAALAVRAGAPVIPAVICPVEERLKRIPHFRPSHRASRVRLMPAYRSVRVVFGPPLYARTEAGVNAVADLTARTRAAMLALLHRHRVV